MTIGQTRRFRQLSVRELLLLIAAISISIGWYFDHTKLQRLLKYSGQSGFIHGGDTTIVAIERLRKHKPLLADPRREGDLANCIINAWQYHEDIDFSFGDGSSFQLARDAASLLDCNRQQKSSPNFNKLLILATTRTIK